MNNEEITDRLSAIEKSIAELRQDVAILVSDKQNRDKANKQFEDIIRQRANPEFVDKVVKKVLSRT